MEKNRMNTNTLVKAAFLTALSVVLTRFFSIILPLAAGPTIRVGFGELPITMSGLLFGPIVGGITGAAADLLGVLINPMGAYHPGFTISAFINGFIPGLLAIYYRKKTKNGSFITFPRVLLAQILNGIVTGLILNTFWLSQLMGNAFLVILPPRIINVIINVPLSSIIIYNILKLFKNETRI